VTHLVKKKAIDKEFFFFLIISMGFMISVAGTRPIIPLFAESLGVSNTLIGLIIATYAFVPFFLSVFLGKSIDKVGTYFPLLLSLSLAIVGLTLLFFLRDTLGILLSQTIVGISQVLFVITMQTYAGSFNNKKTINKYVTSFSIGIALGNFLGPFINGYLAEYFGYHFSFFYSGFFLLFFLPIISFLKVNKKREKKRTKISGKLSELIKIKELRRAFLVSSLILLGKDIYIAFFPLIANSKGLSTSLIGLIISINAGAGIVVRFFLPYILGKKNQDVIMNVLLIGTGLVYLVIAFANYLFLIIFSSMVLGLCVGAGQPLAITKTINSLPNDRTGEGLGLRVSINRLTQIFYPVILGVVATALGFSGVFAVSGVFITFTTIDYKKIIMKLKSGKE